MNHKGHRLAAVILDTEVTQKRAWQQAESLIEATDPETMEPVGTLRTQPTSTPTPTPSAPAETQSPAEHQGDGSHTSPARLAAWGIVIPIGVLLLAVIAASITSLVGKR